METIHNVTQLFIVEKITETVGLEGDIIEDYGDLVDGEVAVCNHINTVQDGASGGGSLSFAGKDAFKLIGRVGNTLIHSDLVEKGTITSWRGTSQAAETQAIDYVGSNGTTGSLGTTTNNVHTIRLYFQEATISGFMQQKIKEGFYKSLSTTLQETICTGLYDSLQANFSRDPEQDINVGRINSGARLALGTGVGTMTFTKGSKSVVAGTAVDDATGAGTILTVGEWIGAGTAVTVPLYKIASIDVGTETITLDRPYQEASSAGADTTVSRVTVATALAADYGIKLLGVNRGFQTGLRNPQPVTWKTSIDFGDNSTTTVVESTRANPGIGTAQIVANLEKELQADNHVYRSFSEGGVIDRAQVTPALIAAGELYDMFVLEYYTVTENGLGEEIRSPKTIIIAGENSSNDSMSDANQGVVQTIDEIVQVWVEAGWSGTDQDTKLT